jgi:SAM-dependent methyltransferase
MTVAAQRGEVVAPMSQAEIFRFFETVRVKELSAFRALCNALKALTIEQAVLAWRGQCKGRLCVLDLGCGRGGDLRKWARFRLKSYVGVDGAALCIEEAVKRQRELAAQGKSSVVATFHVADLAREPVPLPSASVDVASCMFFLQFAFSSEATARHALAEIARVLRPGGVFCALLPDGDRVVQLLSDRRSQVPFGHFRLRKLSGAACGAPFGHCYNFSLVEEACSEYAVSPKWLEGHLRELGFAPVGFGDRFIEPAQHFFARFADSETACTVLREQRCSHVDWLSLGFFSVVFARLADAAPATAEPSAPAPPLEPAKKKRRRGGGEGSGVGGM